MAQSKRIGEKIAAQLNGQPITAFCSPLARARQTLLEILRCIGQGNIKITESSNLKEMDLGLPEGLPWEERRQKYSEKDLDEKLSYLQTPDGESFLDVKKRCQIFMENHLTGQEATQNIIIVSHGITIRVLTNLLLNRPDEDVNYLNWMENTSLTELILKRGIHACQITRLNDYSRLQELKTV